MSDALKLDDLIVRVPDYPKPGIVFQDITPLLGNAAGFSQLIKEMAEPFRDNQISHVLGIEARGFLLASAIANQLNAGLVPIRKSGKLPRSTISKDYELEYGTASIEMHQDAISTGDRIVIVDDVLATGGTIAALLEILTNFDVQIYGISVISEIKALNGRSRIQNIPIHVAIP